MSIPRLAVICDLVEENWPSMDLVAEMLLQKLQSQHASEVQAARICPPLKRRISRLPLVGAQSFAFNADRLLNRFHDYSRYLKRQRKEFDLFHLVDHSYAQLVHELPEKRTIVTCHDIDTFRCLLEPEAHPRSKTFMAMTRRILEGLQKAAWVTCDSEATRQELLKHEVIPAERTVVIHNGVHPACSPEPDEAADAEAARLLGPVVDEAVELLHVGSTIERKRIDVLLKVFALVRKEFPAARLVRVGGEFTGQQTRLVEQLGLSESITLLPALSRETLAAVYRRATLVLQPSEREGFGLPVIEALACGATVLASDLSVLREVGGEAAIYRPVADVQAWSEAVINLLNERREQPQSWAARRAGGLAQAAKFTWAEYAAQMVALYSKLWLSNS
jgi:glycosyltransferase involved in cell wall biosynthesis